MNVKSEVIKRPLGVTLLTIVCLFNVGLAIIFFLLSYNLVAILLALLNVFWALGLYEGKRIVWTASQIQLPISFAMLTLYFTSILFSLIECMPEMEYIISTINTTLTALGIMPAGLGFFLILLINMLCPLIYNMLTSIEPFNRYLAIILALAYVVITLNYLKKEKTKVFFLK